MTSMAEGNRSSHPNRIFSLQLVQQIRQIGRGAIDDGRDGRGRTYALFS